MLTVFGSTALDTIRTPKKTLKNVLGGAATFAAISASFFSLHPKAKEGLRITGGLRSFPRGGGCCIATFKGHNRRPGIDSHGQVGVSKELNAYFSVCRYGKCRKETGV